MKTPKFISKLLEWNVRLFDWLASLISQEPDYEFLEKNLDPHRITVDVVAVGFHTSNSTAKWMLERGVAQGTFRKVKNSTEEDYYQIITPNDPDWNDKAYE